MSVAQQTLPDYNDVRAAAVRVQPAAHRTPVMSSRTLNAMTGAQVFLKCENFQRVGAFKFRGAYNALSQLNDEQKRRGVLTFLEGSLHDLHDKARAEQYFGDARAQAAALPDPARTLLTWVNDRAVEKLGPAVLPHVERLAGDPSLSPEKSPAPTAPVFLLHGRDDNVIPSAETPLTAGYLRRNGNTQVKTLLTPLVSHADLNTNAPIADAWRLVKFWKEMMEIR